MRVMLQDGRRPHGAHGALDEMVHGFGLAAPERHQDHVPGRHDGGQPLGQAVRRHGVQVVPEEPGVVEGGSAA